ncbi:MAG TPA: FGGY family carbohydrate kinase [Chitinophagaceae bacterium]
MSSNKSQIGNKMPDLSSLSEGRTKGEAVVLVFDVGKTNKKVLLFDEQYKQVYEESAQFKETVDEDGFPCEDVDALTKWVWEKFWQFTLNKEYIVRGVNFSAYGASLVHLNDYYKPFVPLYNYLKPYPEKLKKQFYDTYGGESLITKQTASPVLGSLNSGMQLYRLKYEKPKIFEQIKYSLHLPQYLSFIISKKVASDITSIGCHTNLWDFQKNKYHEWIKREKIYIKLAPIFSADKILRRNDVKTIPAGIGLHDSSAALIPYLSFFSEPFILLSTGTWSISLNPFNHQMLSDYELHHDCLCYLTYKGKPVKASRLFAGYEHEQQTKRLAAHFNKTSDYYKSIDYDATKPDTNGLSKQFQHERSSAPLQQSRFVQRDLNDFKTYEEAYYQLIADIILQQVSSTKLVLHNTPVKKIFVDGGFGKNQIFMNMLAVAFPRMEVYAARISQASAMGAALAIHKHWNKNPLPSNIIELTYYPVAHDIRSLM